MKTKIITKDMIISEIKSISERLKTNQLTRVEFLQNSEITPWQVYKHFESWNEAVKEAGLIPHMEKERIDDDRLFLEMKRVFIDAGEICTRMKFARLSKISADVYKKRYGRWNTILLTFREWLALRGEDFPFSDVLNKLYEAQKGRGLNRPQDSEKKETIRDWGSGRGTTYGSFLNFRGLQHAPLNEQGVVFLFGMICHELGFRVEAIRSEYPDCEAKRRINKKRDIWEKVKIEFEYLSSNFKGHGHNPDECDLIVCWEHNWLDCPIEVIELKTEIEKLGT